MLELKRERERRGWSQTKVTILTGIAQSDISAIEHERRVPGPAQRQRIADAFGLPEAQLFRRQDAAR